MNVRDFSPGDRIVKDAPYDQVRVYVVADPVRTPRGKLRVINPKGGITTAWWHHPSTGRRLPRHYRLETR